MNLNESRYSRFGLVRDMHDTMDIIRSFDCSRGAEVVESIKKTKKVLFVGEGSSRIFPAKNFIYQVLEHGFDINAHTEGSRQAAEYDLRGSTVVAASNSGRTAEVVSLFNLLKNRGHQELYSISASEKTPLAEASNFAYGLHSGEEHAVAATKSVIEQAFFYQNILDRVTGKNEIPAKKEKLAQAFAASMSVKIDPRVVEKLASANVLHWAGRNTGVSEELTLKTNEITRKRAVFLSGTYAVHGIEEVMSSHDAVIIVEPYPEEEEKFEQVLVRGVGCDVVAIASSQTRFPTILIPSMPGFDCFLRMAVGWNLLVEIGVNLCIDLDKPERARKIGNEVAPQK